MPNGGRGWGYPYYGTGAPGWAGQGYGYPAWPYAAPFPGPYFGGPFPPFGGYPFGYGSGGVEDAELDYLKGQAEYLEDILDGIKQRIEELEAAKKSK